MKIKDCEDNISIILQLEGGELVLEDMEDVKQLIEVCKPLSYSQGFYGRLLEELEEIQKIEFPVIL